MIPQARNMQEAELHFLSHSEGNLLCVGKDGAEQEVNCYPDADKFFAEHGECDV